MEEEEFTSKSNPFNDPALDKVFVWKKKAKKLGWDKEQAKAHALQVKQQNLVEIQLAKKRRIEREQEMLMKQDERDRRDRERESAAHSDWEQREEDFMLKQHKQSATLRINQGRETPADLIARNVLLMKQLQSGAEIGPDGKETFALSSQVGMCTTSPNLIISTGNAADIHREALRYLELETVEYFQQYWRNIAACCEDALRRMMHVPQAVRESIREYCEAKTLQEISQEKLDALNKQNTGNTEGDLQFYRELELVWRAEEARKSIEIQFQECIQYLTAQNRTEHRVQAWEQVQLQHQRKLRDMENQEDDDLGDNIETLFLECFYVQPITPTKHVKPRFWNRVKLGYDWNKYNRAHYDSENKPPKVVFGYKFNIMYPGLQKAPTYRVEELPGEDGEEGNKFCIIKFIAPEPFLDLGFKVENKDWNRGARSNFKNSFENGVLQLHFNFVRRRYRR